MLPDSHFDSIAKMDMSFNKVDSCVSLLAETSQNYNLNDQKKPISFYSSRLCSQSSFNIIVSGGCKPHSNEPFVNAVQEIDCQDFSVGNELSPMKPGRIDHKLF